VFLAFGLVLFKNTLSTREWKERRQGGRTKLSVEHFSSKKVGCQTYLPATHYSIHGDFEGINRFEEITYFGGFFTWSLNINQLMFLVTGWRNLHPAICAELEIKSKSEVKNTLVEKIFCYDLMHLHTNIQDFWKWLAQLNNFVASYRLGCKDQKHFIL